MTENQKNQSLGKVLVIVVLLAAGSGLFGWARHMQTTLVEPEAAMDEAVDQVRESYLSRAEPLQSLPAGNDEQMQIALKAATAQIRDVEAVQIGQLSRVTNLLIGAGTCWLAGLGLALWRPTRRPVSKTQSERLSPAPLEASPSWA